MPFKRVTQIYTINGMTCGSCEAKVKQALLSIEGISNVEVSKNENNAIISSLKIIPYSEIKNKIDQLGPKYSIDNLEVNAIEKEDSWFETYKPVLLIFCFISLVTLIIEYNQGNFDYHRWMRHFMAGFFLVFSFFKFLNLKGFAESYSKYDLVAKKVPTWAYLYPFVELGLGITFLLNLNPMMVNSVTIVVMGVSIIGVLQSVFNKKNIKCACLGEVFNLPMSSVTIIEDGLMIAMSAWMLMSM